jgi:hypothetical protein
MVKPTTATLVAVSLADMTRSKADLIAENAMLRQQLIVLNRQVKRPQLTNLDRLRLMLLARCTQFWQQALHIVQPDTLIRWHRELFQLYWRYKSRKKNREPRITQETIDLIKQMAQENRLWGAERIRGELLKLGIDVSKRTIQKYLDKLRPTPTRNQAWRTFLKNHAQHIWACDFTTVHDLLFRPVFIFVIIELHTRRIIHTAVTYAPPMNGLHNNCGKLRLGANTPSISSVIGTRSTVHTSQPCSKPPASKPSRPRNDRHGPMPSTDVSLAA